MPLTWTQTPDGQKASGAAEYVVRHLHDPDCHALLINDAVVLYGADYAMRAVAEEYDSSTRPETPDDAYPVPAEYGCPVG